MLEQHISPLNSSENSRSFMGRCVPNFLLMVKENPGKEPVSLQGVRWHWWSVESERKWKRAHSHKSLPIPKSAREPSQLERYQSRGWPQLRLCSWEEEVGSHYSSHSLPGAFEFIHTTCESWFCLELARWTSSYRCTNTGGWSVLKKEESSSKEELPQLLPRFLQAWKPSALPSPSMGPHRQWKWKMLLTSIKQVECQIHLL